MTKVLEATCLAGIVKVGALPVLGATILSEGIASSSGLLLLEADGKYYIAKTSPDLKSALDQVVTALDNVATALSAIDVKPVGGTGSAPAPAAVANITAITAAKTALTALKAALK